jgi:hypothetical protein
VYYVNGKYRPDTLARRYWYDQSRVTGQDAYFSILNFKNPAKNPAAAPSAYRASVLMLTPNKLRPSTIHEPINVRESNHEVKAPTRTPIMILENKNSIKKPIVESHREMKSRQRFLLSITVSFSVATMF